MSLTLKDLRQIQKLIRSEVRELRTDLTIHMIRMTPNKDDYVTKKEFNDLKAGVMEIKDIIVGLNRDMMARFPFYDKLFNEHHERLGSIEKTIKKTRTSHLH